MTVLRSVVREFWRSIREGLSVADAARRVGVGEVTGRTWFRDAGGMPPLELVVAVPGRTLTIEEREQVLAGITAGESIRAIARGLGRAPSTVLRELRANMHHQQYRRRVKPSSGYPARPPWRYSPHRAQLRAEKNARRPKEAKLATDARLRDWVQDRLGKNHSPEQIAHRLVTDFPDEAEMRVSHETIYQSLYVQGRGALRRELVKHLRTGRAIRKPRRSTRGTEQRRSRIPDAVSISERPPEVEDRAVPGHWEGDLIIGSTASNSAIGTLVERASGFVLLLHLPNGHGPVPVRDAMIEAMATLPQTLRRTLTWDRGIEMRNHAQIAAATGLDCYFCDPNSPWQRGSNENANGLLRQYFPKGTDLSFWGAGYLQTVAAELNNRPRKRHNWATPAEVLDQLLSNPTKPSRVAMTS